MQQCENKLVKRSVVDEVQGTRSESSGQIDEEFQYDEREAYFQTYSVVQLSLFIDATKDFAIIFEDIQNSIHITCL
jgi:hypothetical protein